MEESLNIEEKRRNLVLKALNKFAREKEAYKALGISEKTLSRYKKNYGIEKCVVTGEYSFREKKFLKVIQIPKH
ncbi:MAG TPA: hypothetical protein VG847_00985 [Chitinophagaceae bacterium]|nr:hypothetical protein [Chitinophagaceae bacterium]